MRVHERNQLARPVRNAVLLVADLVEDGGELAERLVVARNDDRLPTGWERVTGTGVEVDGALGLDHHRSE